MGLCAAWITAADVALRPDCDGIDEATRRDAAWDASELLYGLTGRKYPGLCTTTLRPATRPPATPIGDWVARLASYNGVVQAPASLYRAWRDVGDYAGQWGRIPLVHYPVRAVTQVKIDGSVLSSSAYRVDDFSTLVRTDGGGWPLWQRLELNDDQPGTFSVTVQWGADPPQSGIGAVTTFAAELAKSRASLPNKLPTRITSITREGVAMAILDAMTYVKEGWTSIYEIDLFIRNENPSHAIRPPMSYSPDRPHPHTTGARYV